MNKKFKEDLKWLKATPSSFDADKVSRFLHDEPAMWEEPKYDLKYCENCIQMTNHIKDTCMKCLPKSTPKNHHQ